jgi:hypothetical protein
VTNLLDAQNWPPSCPSWFVHNRNLKPRQVKIYKNPHTGEVVETKGGNHKTLKEWKAEHGSATVESWLSK